MNKTPFSFFLGYFNDCDHSLLTDNMFIDLKSWQIMLSTMSLKFHLFSFLSLNKSKPPTKTASSSHGPKKDYLLLYSKR